MRKLISRLELGPKLGLGHSVHSPPHQHLGVWERSACWIMSVLSPSVTNPISFFPGTGNHYWFCLDTSVCFLSAQAFSIHLRRHFPLTYLQFPFSLRLQSFFAVGLPVFILTWRGSLSSANLGWVGAGKDCEGGRDREGYQASPRLFPQSGIPSWLVHKSYCNVHLEGRVRAQW